MISKTPGLVQQARRMPPYLPVKMNLSAMRIRSNIIALQYVGGNEEAKEEATPIDDHDVGDNAKEATDQEARSDVGEERSQRPPIREHEVAMELAKDTYRYFGCIVTL